MIHYKDLREVDDATPDRFTADQTPGVVDAFERGLFTWFRPKRIVELGTQNGGMTAFMADWGRTVGVHLVLTVDVADCHVGWARKGYDNVVQIFKDQYELGPELRSHLDVGPRLVLCDGGNLSVGGKLKQMEFIDGLGVMEVGDVLMSHDYPKPNGGGLTEDDAAEFCKRGYEKRCEKIFLEVEWLCLRRI